MKKFKISCLNPISQKGMKNFTDSYEKTEDLQEADAFLVRSANLHEMDFPDQLVAIARGSRCQQYSS